MAVELEGSVPLPGPSSFGFPSWLGSLPSLSSHSGSSSGSSQSSSSPPLPVWDGSTADAVGEADAGSVGKTDVGSVGDADAGSVGETDAGSVGETDAGSVGVPVPVPGSTGELVGALNVDFNI